ncbi:MAG: hypothetical protein QM484_12580 [Woeseiaceae bacterium]
MKPIKFWYLFVGFVLAMLLLSCGTNTPQKLPSQVSHYSEYDESGIGGTGILASQSGIGGTGIIGEITGFGSIFVNGVEVEVEPQTLLYVDGKKVSKHHFARGEIVVLHTEQKNSLSFAREIFIRHEVIGQVKKLMPQLQRAVILGQVVDTSALSIQPIVGEVIRVSGFRGKEGIIHARHISKANDRQSGLLVGKLKYKDNNWFIGQQQVRLPSASSVKAGDVVRIRGEIRESVLQVNNVQRLDQLPFSIPVKNILIQAALLKNNAGQFRMNTLAAQVEKRANSVLFLQRGGAKQGWRLNRIFNRQQLPKGAPMPSAIHHRPPQQVRPMSRQAPSAMQYPFFR